MLWNGNVTIMYDGYCHRVTSTYITYNPTILIALRSSFESNSIVGYVLVWSTCNFKYVTL